MMCAMKSYAKFLVACVALFVATALSPATVEAQFLKKLTQGIEKVNKALDKAEQKAEQIKEGIEDVSNGNLSNLFKGKRDKSEADETSDAGYAYDDDRAAVADDDMVAEAATPRWDDSDMEEVEPVYHHPYITRHTKYMMLDNVYDTTISGVHEGVFAIDEGGKWSFWRTTGEKLFDSDWAYCSESRGYGNQYPKFSGGVAVARKADSWGRGIIYLLYLDGSVKELDPAWTKVSEFVDGLAMVTVNGGQQYHYINIKGEKQYPQLKLYGGDEWSMRPVRDGLRAYATSSYKWGYLDAKGNVVIEPIFGGVSDFSEGYAWVIAKEDPASLFSNGELALINTRGEVVYRTGISWSGGNFKGSYLSKVSDVVDGRFYVRSDDYYHYYDVNTFKKIGMADYGTPFYKGYAFIEPLEDWGSDLCLVDTDFKLVKRLSEDLMFTTDLRAMPRFTSLGVATIHDKSINSHVIDHMGNIVLSSYFGDDLEYDGYAQFTEAGMMRVNDIRINGTMYRGIVDTRGEVLWLFGEKPAEEDLDQRWPDPQPTPGRLNTPDRLRATRVTSSSISVRWSGVAGAVGYSVKFVGGALTDVSGTTHTFTGLKPNTTYTVMVVAKSDGSKLDSKPAVATIKTKAEGEAADPIVLDAPANLRGENIKLRSFDAVWDVVDNAVGYEVTLDDAAATFTGDAALSFEELKQGTEYTVTVVARGDGVNFLNSAPAVCTIKTKSNSGGGGDDPEPEPEPEPGPEPIPGPEPLPEPRPEPIPGPGPLPEPTPEPGDKEDDKGNFYYSVTLTPDTDIDIVVLDKNTTSEGPTTTEKMQYLVTVKCDPAEGGTASISPKVVYEYGDEATLKVSAAEDWAVGYISVEQSRPGLSPNVGESFTVTQDMVITVHFVEKDDEEPVPMTNSYQGTKRYTVDEGEVIDLPIYAEFSAEGALASPYGDNTRGFIVPMFDPTTRYISKDVSAYLFSSPLKVHSYQYDENTERHWLVADGGSFILGDLKVSPINDNGFAAFILQLMLAFDGHSSPSLTPRHYRLEMLDFNAETGEFRCGKLETFSPQYGWLSSGDERLTIVTEGVFSTKKDRGLPADLFEGAQMKIAPKRDDVWWYPPLLWYEDQSILNLIIEEMGSAYRSFKSEYDVLFE